MRTWLLAALPLFVAALVVACGGGTDGAGGTDDDATEVDALLDAEQADDTAAAENSDTEDTEDDAQAAADADGDAAAAATDTEASDGADASEDAAPAAVTPVVYNRDFSQSIQPIFADRCASCHSPGGPGTAHWELTTAQDLADDHRILSEIVASGYMPPWPAGGESPPFKYDRSLRDDQLQAILDWSADGGSLDVAGSTPIAAVNGVVGLANPDAVVGPELPYAGSPTAVDDYRCQVYDPKLADGGWITAYEFIPDQTEVVHHAIGYLLPASAREQATQKDGADGKPGWQCYGSSGLGADDIFLGWAPGQDPSLMPDGTGLWVDPGAFIVVQIHYHYEGSAPEDLSTLALNVEEPAADLDPIQVTQYIAPAEIPCTTEEDGPLCDREAALADAIDRYGSEGVQADRFLRLCGYTPDDFADMTDGTASASCDIPAGFVGGTGEIVSVLGHEHELGAWFKMTLNPDTPEEKVLLDIPVWDFDWQYNYEPEETIVLGATDVIRLECGWDRSLRDPNLEPAYILWADGTNDEMCFGTISTRPAS